MNIAAIDATLITAISSAAAVILGCLFTGILSIIKLVKSNAKLVESTAKIEAHVNSEKTASEGREVALRKEIDLLREGMIEQSTTAKLLAQATATTTDKIIETSNGGHK